MQFQTLLTRLAAACWVALAAASAQAETYNFTLTGDYTASWQLDSIPATSGESYQAFYMDNVSGTFNGTADVTANLAFFVGYQGGGLSIDSVLLSGYQLFTGNLYAPVFKSGTFQLWEIFYDPVVYFKTYTLTISPAPAPAPAPAPVAAVPEPATVALMLAGLGVVGGVASRCRKAGGEQAAAA